MVQLVERRRVLSNTAKADYSKQYLTFEAIEDSTFSFSRNNLQYSLDNGTTWTTLPNGTASPTVVAGNKIIWKCLNPTLDTNYGIGTFSSTGAYKAYGNTMSLFYGDDFELKFKAQNTQRLFYNNRKLVDAANLVLPATTLIQGCYYNMFKSCTSLINAPELPATTLVIQCYGSMFDSCVALITAPKLPAMKVGAYCYSFMFSSCMSLINAPELPATTLASECYSGMFNGCIALTNAPELPATQLMEKCYRYMFQGCKQLSYIKCLATTNMSAYDCLYNWVNGVSATGTFVKDASMTSWPTGNDGIPSGWTVEDA